MKPMIRVVLLLFLQLVTLWFLATRVADASTTPRPSSTTLRALIKEQIQKQERRNTRARRRRLLNYSLRDSASWFRAYRKQFGREVDLCLFLTNPNNRFYNLNPETGAGCPIKRKEYWCGLGEQSCRADTVPNARTHPEIKCFCEDGVFQCNDYDPCMLQPADTPEPTTEQRTPTPSSGPVATTEAPSAEDIPLVPPTPPIIACPAELPEIGSSSAFVCPANLTCTYGTETCCGDTYDAVTCSCLKDEMLDCRPNGMCLNRECLKNCPEEAQEPESDDSCTPSLFEGSTTVCGYGRIDCSCDGIQRDPEDLPFQKTCTCDATTEKWQCVELLCTECFSDPSVSFGETCGGLHGTQCFHGLECVDNPNDLCDPKNGDADCTGICLQPACPVGVDYTYLGDERTCPLIDVACPAGTEMWTVDGCGCGCKPKETKDIECPVIMPSTGETCNLPGEACEYDYCIVFDRNLTSCECLDDGTFGACSKGADCPVQDPTCPTVKPASGDTCGNPGGACTYDRCESLGTDLTRCTCDPDGKFLECETSTSKCPSSTQTCPLSAAAGGRCTQDCKYDYCDALGSHLTHCQCSPEGVLLDCVGLDVVCPNHLCPYARPTPGESCTIPGENCKYDYCDALGTYLTTCTCQDDSTFGACATSRVLCPDDVSLCPMEQPAPHSPCSVPGESCEYDFCFADGKYGTTCSCTAANEYQCRTRVEPCPTNDPGPNIGTTCGGFAGKVCEDPLVCVDDPNDSCDPENGGADCPGLCLTDKCPVGPHFTYVGNDELCTRVLYICEDGFEPWFVKGCGCGCRPKDGRSCPDSIPTLGDKCLEPGDTCGYNQCPGTDFYLTSCLCKDDFTFGSCIHSRRACPAPGPSIGEMCGGSEAIECASGLRCVDDPNDLCAPPFGTHCSGICVSDTCPVGTGVTYKGDDESCKTITFICPAGSEFWSASGCGCGCQPQQPTCPDAKPRPGDECDGPGGVCLYDPCPGSTEIFTTSCECQLNGTYATCFSLGVPCPLDVGPASSDSCPSPIPNEGDACTNLDETCEYGEVCCGDNCYTETTCKCKSDGTFERCNTIAVRCSDPVCPIDRPVEGTKCSTPGHTCTYDNVCCPNGGPCQDSTFCSCGDDGFFGPCAMASIFCPEIIQDVVVDDPIIINDPIQLDPIGISPLPDQFQKTSWPEFVGQPCNQDMIDTIKSENVLLNEVTCIPDGAFVTLDVRDDRVRIFMDQNGNVDVAPRVG